MRPNDIPMALVLIVGTLQCALGPVQAGPVHKNEPAHVDPIPGTKLNRVVLEPKALERLGIETTEVQETTAARKRLVAADLIGID